MLNISDETRANAAVAHADRRDVLARAFDVLACCAGGADRSVAEICAETGLPAATVHRLLGTLHAQGVIDRAAWGRYRLGSQLWWLGHGVPAMHRLREAARPALVDLHAATELPVVLAMRDQERLRLVDKIAGRRTMSVCEQLGNPLLDAHPGGWVVLAHDEPARLDAELAAEIRTCGYAVSTDTRDPLLWAAAPVLIEGRPVEVSVMICGQRGQHAPDVLGRTIRTTADRIGRR